MVNWADIDRVSRVSLTRVTEPGPPMSPSEVRGSQRESFRYSPAAPRPDLVIDRPRLVQLLNGRFEHRLTTLVAAAGYGKTTALALAVESNRHDPLGDDVWLGATSSDGGGSNLLSGLAVALGAEPDPDDTRTLERIRRAVWARAPHDVALVIDDAHLVHDSPAGADTIRRILDALPDNGHLVLAGRTPPQMPLARLRAHGQVLELDARTLELDDRELAELRQVRGAGRRANLPRHAATADLRLRASRGVDSSYLREEILATLHPDRLHQLARVAVLGELDEELVREVTDGEYDLARLVDGLPLVESHASGSARLHGLLVEALADHLSPADRDKTLTVAADVEERRGRFAIAVRLFDEAGEAAAALDAALAFALAPTMLQPMASIIEISAVVDRLVPDGALSQFFAATRMLAHDEASATAAFRRAAVTARESGERLLEALALHRMVQFQFLDGVEVVDHDGIERLRELARDVPFAASAVAHAESQIEQFAGRPEHAARLDDYDGFGEHAQVVMRTQRFCDLGRPEDALQGTGRLDFATLAPGAEVFLAFALWLSGSADPEFSQAAVGDMIPTVLQRGLSHTAISTLGTGTIISLAAGDVATARRRAARTAELCAPPITGTIGLFQHVTRAAVAAMTESDAAAGAALDPAVTGLPIEHWPYRPHLLILPLVYLTRPETRPVIDRCEFGRALTVAVEAGRALVALREQDDAARAVELPWHDLRTLRALVLPHHLAELACAAVATGNQLAEAALSLPPIERQLERVAHGDGTAADHARMLLHHRPRPVPYTVHVRMLGGVDLQLDGADVATDDWRRRGKVRELFALLVQRRRVERTEVIAAVWPDHPDESRAAANLRTLLSTLNGVLEPERSAGDDPFFVRTDGELLIAHSSITTDVDEFEEIVDAARLDDRSNLPARALDGYRSALELYRGDLLLGHDAVWAVMERIRLRAMAVDAACRVAELTAAKGEPVEAARWAARAQELEPLSERAGRLFVSALASHGDTASARAAADDLVGRFSAAGLELGGDTRRLLERVVGRRM